VAVHAVLFALAIRSVKIIGPPPEPRAVDLQLVQLLPPPLRREQPRPVSATPSSAPALAAPASTAPAPPTPAVIAPAAIPAQPAPSDDAAARVRAMLRSSTGCESAALLRLTQAEQQKCAKWRLAQADPNLQIPAPMDPRVRAWDEASLQYRHNGRYMPTGPPGRGPMVVPGLPPGHTLAHLGPFSVGLPPGAFDDDDAPPP
jgi:hypothetical protein